MNEALEKINFGQLKVFFCTAELESFTKAADHLHITQSAVSKIISKLEEELDIQLFTRHYREIHITQAGLDLYKAWKEQARLISDSYEEVYLLQHQKDNQLQIGATNTTDLNTYFWPVITAFEQKYPECRTELDSDNMEHLIEKLENGKLDLVFVPDFLKYRVEEKGLLWKWAARDYVQILMPTAHPFAKKELTLELLKDEPILLLDEGVCPENVRFVKEMFASEGYEVKLSSKTYRTPDGVIEFYRSSDGITVADSFFKYDYSDKKMIHKPLAGHKNGIICAWNGDNASKYLANMLRELPCKAVFK